MSERRLFRLAEEMAHAARGLREAFHGDPEAAELTAQLGQWLKAEGEPEAADTFGQCVVLGLSSTAALVGDPLDLDHLPLTSAPRGLLAELLIAAQRLDRALLDRPLAKLIASLRQWSAEANVEARQSALAGSYEIFASRYHRTARRRRGVYYTPKPIVTFVVRSLDAIIRRDLGWPLGLADPRATVLEPAIGSGAFIIEVLELTRDTLLAHWRADGVAEAGLFEQWRRWVRRELPGRLMGFEIAAAACLVTHIRVGAWLAASGADLAPGLDLRCASALSAPVAFAREPVIIVSNPPWSRTSANRGEWIAALMADYKTGLETERNLQPLSDDYLKFIRLAHWYQDERNAQVFGMVCNQTLLVGDLHRSARAALCEGAHIDVVDLGGRDDGNLFEIRQPAALVFRSVSPEAPKVSFAAFEGTIAQKTHALNTKSVGPWMAELEDRGAGDPFTPRGVSRQTEARYGGFTSVRDLFDFASVGGKPGDDRLLVSMTAGSVRSQVAAAKKALDAGHKAPRTEAQRKLAAWSGEVETAAVIPYDYRPFDPRWTLDLPAIWTRPVSRLRAYTPGALCLLVTRSARREPWAHVFVTEGFPDVILLSSASSTNCYVLPFEDLDGVSNMSIDEAGRRLGFRPERSRLFAYVYAVLHSGIFRQTFGPLLARAFPRVPLEVGRGFFDAMADAGQRLLDVHLGRAKVESPAFYFGDDREVTKVGRVGRLLDDLVDGIGTVRINPSSGFGSVPRRAWEMQIGGHQVCYKWLADRRRAKVSLDDASVARYIDVVGRMVATVQYMDAIDDLVRGQGDGFA